MPKFVIDKENELPMYSAYCNLCKHVLGKQRCKAFDIIPDNIWLAKKEHNTPSSKQQGGFIFERVSK